MIFGYLNWIKNNLKKNVNEWNSLMKFMDVKTFYNNSDVLMQLYNGE